MHINFEKTSFLQKRFITKIFNEALRQTKNQSENLVINISFVDAEQIKALNLQHRNIDRATDVLSFPMLEIAYPQTIKEFEDEISPDGNLYLGDIVICKEVAEKQAKEYGHSIRREIGFLALHGLLHLLGYDHIEKEEEHVMMSISENILSSLKLTREVRDV